MVTLMLKRNMADGGSRDGGSVCVLVVAVGVYVQVTVVHETRPSRRHFTATAVDNGSKRFSNRKIRYVERSECVMKVNMTMTESGLVKVEVQDVRQCQRT